MINRIFPLSIRGRRFLLSAFFVSLALASTAIFAQTLNTGGRWSAPDPAGPEQLVPGPGYDILYAPSEGDDPAFRAAISAFTSGSVDYYDARFSTPGMPLLVQYECVMTWANFAYHNAVAMGDNLAAYVDGGGQVVLGAFANTSPGNPLLGAITGPGYSPVTGAGNHFSSSSYAGNGTTPIHNGVTAYSAYHRDILTLQGAGVQDGSFLDGEIATAYRPDFAVVYANGAGAPLSGTDPDWPLLIANACQAGYTFEKDIVAGNDLDFNGIPDKVVEAGITSPALYWFIIDYFNPAGPYVTIKDIVPREWNAFYFGGWPPCSIVRADERRNLFSDNFITCYPTTDAFEIFIAQARCGDTPGDPMCHPYECGAFYLNEGAQAWVGRALIDTTDPLCLAAVKDLNGFGLVYDGTGDEDGDGVDDYTEACVNFTDPCDAGSNAPGRR